MGRNFLDIAFTPAVKAEQERHGSRAGYAAFLSRGGTGLDDNVLGSEEAGFISARDGFYMATVSETGWPYLQFRGGDPGFVHILAADRLGWADLRGNRQYVSIGNLARDNRVSLFFMDYLARRRLKVFGRVVVKELETLQDLAPHLAATGDQAHVEHQFELTVAGFDWNCPQHIPQRFTLREIDAVVAPLKAHIATLERRLEDAGLHPGPMPSRQPLEDGAHDRAD